MTDSTDDGLLEIARNLSQFHREHEKYYSEAPLADAIALQRSARTLMALAERWTSVETAMTPPASSFAGAPDLNDDRAIETSGVRFMAGEGEPAEITRMKTELTHRTVPSAGCFDHGTSRLLTWCPSSGPRPRPLRPELPVLSGRASQPRRRSVCNKLRADARRRAPLADLPHQRIKEITPPAGQPQDPMPGCGSSRQPQAGRDVAPGQR